MDRSQADYHVRLDFDEWKSKLGSFYFVFKFHMTI